MPKRGAMQATLAHLLVILSLVIESNQAPNFFGGKSEEWLREQLQSGILSRDGRLECMKKVSSPSRIAIGGTNVEELIQLSKMSRKHCNDATYRQREEVCQKAKYAGYYYVNDYCEDRLIKLTWFCADNHYERITFNRPAHPDTVTYFYSLFSGVGSKILGQQEITKLGLEYVWDADGHKSNGLNYYCSALKLSTRQSGLIQGGPNWDNAYNLCKFYFGRSGMKFEP